MRQAVIVAGFGFAVVVALFTPTAATATALTAIAVVGLLFFLAARAEVGRLEGRATHIVWPALLAPVTYGLQPFLGTLTLLPLAGLLVMTLRPREGRVAPLLLALVVGACTVPIVVNSTHQYILLGSAILLLGYRVATRFPRANAVTSLIDGVGLFLVANFLMYMAGVSSPSAASRTGGLDLATGDVRVFFPLGSSIQTGPVMAAIFLAAAIALHDKIGWRLVYRATASVVAVAVLVQAGSRIPLLLALTLGGLSMLRPRLLMRVAVPLPVAVLSLWAIFPHMQNAVVRPALEVASAVLPQFRDRADGGDSTLNGRSIIWDNAWTYWNESHLDVIHKLFGFGSAGQRTSGASATYSDLFSGGYSEPLAASVHNTGLQQLFDGGLLGFLSLLGLCVYALMGWRRDFATHLDARIGTTALLGAIASGASEVMIAPGYGHVPFIVALWLMLFGRVEPTLPPDGTASKVSADRKRGAEQMSLILRGNKNWTAH
ncbi:MAG: O-antigen ligase family protein [Propionibacteriales bacterium]|nr:O-antigen ligase family protein [Propionibacteriales bacterium]